MIWIFMRPAIRNMILNNFGLPVKTGKDHIMSPICLSRYPFDVLWKS